jgi:beta-mannosidase
MRVRPNCHGSLFWMYEDCWGEVGWTIVDYARRRKISWYFVRRTYAPLRLILRPAGPDTVRVVLANDTLTDERLDVEYGYVPLDGSAADLATAAVRAPAVSRTALCEIAKGAHDPCAGLWIARVPGRPDILPGIFRAVDFRELRTVAPGLRCTARREEGGVRVTVTAKAYAHAVHFLGLPPACEPEDNYVDLLPGERREIVIADPAGVRLDPKAIRATCLNASGRGA